MRRRTRFDHERLLQLGSFERRSGGWRFGTKIILDQVVERLVDSGVARIEGDKVVLATPED